jgi:Lrp/AsnC family transcriptional regulator, regulator for asnA, asnC and gidA
MRQNGIIKGATIHINYKSFGCKAVAHMQISLNPSQEDQFLELINKNPGIYTAISNGPKGNITVITAFKTLHELNQIKSEIRQNFSISEIKTSIWTDVKEMHENLCINPVETENTIEESKNHGHLENVRYFQNSKVARLDEIDEKIAEKLSENGRTPWGKIAKEVGISAVAAQRRYEKLKKNGILKVTIQFDPIRIGYPAAAIFSATISNENSSIIEKISQIQDVISIMKTAGDYDLQIWILIASINQLLKTKEELDKIQGITKMDLQIMRMPNIWPTPRQYISTF